ncbi:KTSC domain-containing protein [Halalkalibacter oceani]|uniref:KTSC domain-containing protein n=1 Tax=Halalkalibacter oceani TaxID=1653776 RepID=UPI0033956E3F
MRMVPVSSSNLNSVGYDENTQTLRIDFHNGTYDYYNVPRSVYDGLLNASSKGQFHHNYIKNDFRNNRIG